MQRGLDARPNRVEPEAEGEATVLAADLLVDAFIAFFVPALFTIAFIPFIAAVARSTSQVESTTR